jgi:hypothetical protein
VLVAPTVLPDLELELMALDLRVWPVQSAPICEDGPRQAFQIRRRLIESRRGAWDDATEWIPVWISFGSSWRLDSEPLPWAAHATLWQSLASYGAQVRFHKRLGGVALLALPPDLAASA